MKRVCSIFSQVLQLIPRDRFEAAVGKHHAERHARGFSSWGQFVACCSASWGRPNRCARSRRDCRPVQAPYADQTLFRARHQWSKGAALTS